MVIDYQNIHLSGHGKFCPEGVAIHESLIHPLYFANQVILGRKAAMNARGTDPGDVSLTLVDTYRGLPTNKEQPDHYRRSLAQRSEWTRDRRVSVTYRPLKYRWEDGQRVAREKGVDVLVALAVVRLVQSGDYDLVILAAHDSDLEPALEQSVTAANVQEGRVKLETAGWQDCKRLKAGPGATLWHTFLRGDSFVRARDLKQY